MKDVLCNSCEELFEANEIVNYMNVCKVCYEKENKGKLTLLMNRIIEQDKKEQKEDLYTQDNLFFILEEYAIEYDLTQDEFDRLSAMVDLKLQIDSLQEDLNYYYKLDM
jgi:hypothetical protein